MNQARKICGTCSSWYDITGDSDRKEFGQCFERKSPLNGIGRRWDEGCEAWSSYEETASIKCCACGATFISDLYIVRLNDCMDLCGRCMEHALRERDV